RAAWCASIEEEPDMGLTRSIAALALAAAAHGVLVADAAAQQTAQDSTAQSYDAPRAALSGRRSWLSDRRDFRPGDLITVLVDEYTLATANKATIASRDRSSQATLDVEDATARPGRRDVVDLGLRSRVGTESRERGQATRQDRLAAEITVRVVEIAPSGLMRVEGGKTVIMDEHEQYVTLTGWVRPEDVTPQNVVESWRIADSRIEYRAEGKLGKPRGGLLSRILGVI